MADAWDRAILSNPAIVACDVRGEKGGAEIEASLPFPSDYCGYAPSRVLPKIRIPQNPRLAEQLVRRKISSTLSLGSLQVKTSLDRYKEWIKATEKEVGAVT